MSNTCYLHASPSRNPKSSQLKDIAINKDSIPFMFKLLVSQKPSLVMSYNTKHRVAICGDVPLLKRMLPSFYKQLMHYHDSEVMKISNANQFKVEFTKVLGYLRQVNTPNIILESYDIFDANNPVKTNAIKQVEAVFKSIKILETDVAEFIEPITIATRKTTLAGKIRTLLNDHYSSTQIGISSGFVDGSWKSELKAIGWDPDEKHNIRLGN